MEADLKLWKQVNEDYSSLVKELRKKPTAEIKELPSELEGANDFSIQSLDVALKPCTIVFTAQAYKFYSKALSLA